MKNKRKQIKRLLKKICIYTDEIAFLKVLSHGEFIFCGSSSLKVKIK